MMEMFQPTPILPSNAPPWTGNDNDSTQLQVLQDHTNNRHLRFLPSQRCKSGFSAHGASDEDDCVSLDSFDSRNDQEEISYFPRHASEYGYSSNESSYTTGSNNSLISCSKRLRDQPSRRPGEAGESRTVRKLEAAARKLAVLFAKCDSYIKYRTRQPKEGRVKEEQKWPDHMEDAFLRALVRWPPVGRKKTPPRAGVGPKGRNECIADYIYMATGEKRTRKQVSSHIQVLKSFVRDEPDIMYYLSKEHKEHPNRHANAMLRRRASMYPIRIQDHSHTKEMSVLQALDLEVKEFKMFMRSSEHADPPFKTLHEYTCFDVRRGDGGEQAINVHDAAHVFQVYPELARLQPSRLQRSKLLSMKASLALHDPEIAEQIANNNIELAISFAFQGPATTTLPRVACRTTLYRNGILEGNDNLMGQARPLRFDNVEVTATKDLEGRSLNQYVVLNFRSTFWAETIWRLVRDQQNVDMLATSSLDLDETLEMRQAHVSNLQDSVSSSLRSITAVQEFIASVSPNSSETDPFLTIHWSFCHAPRGEAGTTSWRPVIFSRTAFDQHDGALLSSRHEPPTYSKIESFHSDIGGTSASRGADDLDYYQTLYPYQPDYQSHVSDLSAYQSPISFSAGTNGGPSEGAWANTGGIIPSTTIGAVVGGLGPYSTDVDFADDDDNDEDNNTLKLPYSSSGLASSQDLRVVHGHQMTHCTGLDQADLGSNYTSSQHHHQHHDFSDMSLQNMDMHSMQQLHHINHMNRTYTQEQLNTDPLLQSFDVIAPWSGGGGGGGALRAYDEKMIEHEDGISFATSATFGASQAATAATGSMPSSFHASNAGTMAVENDNGTTDEDNTGARNANDFAPNEMEMHRSDEHSSRGGRGGEGRREGIPLHHFSHRLTTSHHHEPYSPTQYLHPDIDPLHQQTSYDPQTQKCDVAFRSTSASAEGMFSPAQYRYQTHG